MGPVPKLPHHMSAAVMRPVPSDDVHSPIGVMANEMPATMMAAKTPDNLFAPVGGVHHACGGERGEANNGQRDRDESFHELLLGADRNRIRSSKILPKIFMRRCKRPHCMVPLPLIGKLLATDVDRSGRDFANHPAALNDLYLRV